MKKIIKLMLVVLAPNILWGIDSPPSSRLRTTSLSSIKSSEEGSLVSSTSTTPNNSRPSSLRNSSDSSPEADDVSLAAMPRQDAATEIARSTAGGLAVLAADAQRWSDKTGIVVVPYQGSPCGAGRHLRTSAETPASSRMPLPYHWDFPSGR